MAKGGAGKKGPGKKPGTVLGRVNQVRVGVKKRQGLATTKQVRLKEVQGRVDHAPEHVTPPCGLVSPSRCRGGQLQARQGPSAQTALAGLMLYPLRPCRPPAQAGKQQQQRAQWREEAADELLAELLSKAGADTKLAKLQYSLGYTFREPRLLEQALTHSTANRIAHNAR
jgi:hypothetical protein